jgi:hypothetical protein
MVQWNVVFEVKQEAGVMLFKSDKYRMSLYYLLSAFLSVVHAFCQLTNTIPWNLLFFSFY